MKPFPAHIGKVSALCSQLAAGLLFLLRLPAFYFPPTFNVQVLVMLGVVAGLTVATLVLKKPRPCFPPWACSSSSSWWWGIRWGVRWRSS